MFTQLALKEYFNGKSVMFLMLQKFKAVSAALRKVLPGFLKMALKLSVMDTRTTISLEKKIHPVKLTLE